MMSWKQAGLAVSALGVLVGGVVSADPPKKVNFKSEVMPLLRAHCTSCHNSEVSYGRLRLDTIEGIKKGGKSGPLWSGTDPTKSLLMQRMKGEGGKEQMPKGFGPLSKAKLDTFANWIKQGASFEGKEVVHWSYVAPVKPPIPPVKNPSWVANPIDAFIASELEKEKLSPTQPAPAATLLRRLYLDITGLPPTVEEADAYLSNPTKENYNKIVDSLLAKPSYGEKMAMTWLDLARFADSNGYEKDGNRTIWPYRDWVINAYNMDMPYPRFIEEQLAGDLLPDSNKSTLIATGFQRNTMLNEEGGVDKGEQRWLTLVDRVSVTGSAFLATSIQCAQCHDHKYDPVKQVDFFKMLAYYESSSEPTLMLDEEKYNQLSTEASHLQKELTQLSGKPTEKDVKEKIDALNQQMARMRAEQSTLVLREDPEKKPETLFRNKGAYLQPGETVAAGLPEFLTPKGRKGPENRLTLAKWIGSRENPLTARVAVNRVWEGIFGFGLVKTSDDFGTQGEFPRHQALLDWMAVEFIEKGWSFKQLMKLIVTSNTYKQSSAVTKAQLDKDPENRLLGRGARFRLPAESIRDNSLAAAGLLSSKVGGPSVMPDQPEGVWDLPYNDEKWTISKGDDRWRRGLYTHWKRSSPYPMFLNFDATSREVCTTRRIRTNTPLQALALLNDTGLLEAARVLAMKSWRPGGGKIAEAFRRVLVRKPTPEETKSLANLMERLRATYAKDPALAEKLVPSAPPGSDRIELAAATLVCQTILNLDEAITRE